MTQRECAEIPDAGNETCVSTRRHPNVEERLALRRQFVEQGFGFLQVLGVEALGEPVVDGGE